MLNFSTRDEGELTILKPTTVEDRLKVAAWLHGLAEAVARNDYEIEPHAAIVVLTDGDVHAVFREGYRDWKQIQSAAYDAQTVNSRFHSGANAIERADRRRELAAHHETERRSKLAEKPHTCYCRDRFKTERGLRQHIALARKPKQWELNTSPLHMPFDPEPEGLALVPSPAASGGAG